MAREKKMIARNRRATHDYHILETFEAGIVLSGTEVCSLRENNCQITDSFALVRKGELWLNNVHIAPYSHGNINNVNPDRARKLLVHKKEIRYLQEKTREKGFSIVPLSIYFAKNNLVKVEIALVQGKKLYDKRQDIAKRDFNREMQREAK